MTWFKLDDDFFAHPKVLAAGNAAIGLYCRMGSWCSKHSHDGRIPHAVAITSGTKREIGALVDVGLWEVIEGGYQVHDFNDYNPTPEQVAATKAARAEAGRRGGKQRSSKLLGNGQANGQAESNPVPGPVPEPFTSETDDDSKVAVIHHLSSSSFAEQVTMGAARLLLAQQHHDVKNHRAWLASTARTMLTERADAILDAHARGMSVEIAAEYILTRPCREVDPPIRREIYVERAATYGRSVKAQQCAGENADMPEANREAFLAELDGAPGDAWYDAAVAAYDEWEPPMEGTR